MNHDVVEQQLAKIDAEERAAKVAEFRMLIAAVASLPTDASPDTAQLRRLRELNKSLGHILGVSDYLIAYCDRKRMEMAVASASSQAAKIDPLAEAQLHDEDAAACELVPAAQVQMQTERDRIWTQLRRIEATRKQLADAEYALQSHRREFTELGI